MITIDLADDTTVDYGTEAELFGYGSDADQRAFKSRKSQRQVIRYRRFRNAAEAIRYAVEEMPAKFLVSVYMEVDEVRFSGAAIRRLYDRVEYPLARRDAA